MMEQTIREILNDKPNKIIISNPKVKQQKFRKIVIRPVVIKNVLMYQCEKFTQQQVFHVNIEENALIATISTFMNDFKQCDVFNEKEVIMLKISKKGKIFISRSKAVPMPIKNESSHNRKKQYLIPEGVCIEPLVDLGVFTKEGKIVSSMYDKYKQINRFIEMIDDCINEDMKSLNIIDFGCGKSYLTFILYYYLVYMKKIKVHMIGLDLKTDVIAKCNKIADKYGYEDLHFEVGDIHGYQCNMPVDMVISLHACDTATDYALYNAIKWNAKMIFSVPCCQHELNGQIQSEKLSLVTRYGLLKERSAALMSDMIRAGLLESESYKVQVLEFIDMMHSPKNILLRCVKSNTISEKKKQEALKEVEALMETFMLQPTLYRLLRNG